MVAFLLTVALALVGLPSTTLAGVQDAPFPTFSDGKASQLALLIPTAIKINNLDTEVICTNLAPAAVDIGLEVFDQTGTRANTTETYTTADPLSLHGAHGLGVGG